MTLWRAGWRRLRRDRLSLLALAVLAAIAVGGFAGGAIVTRLVGHDGTSPFPYAANSALRPIGPWTRVPALSNAPIGDYGQVLAAPKGTKRTLFVLGADGPLGRDELIRLLDGARTSLEVALGAVLVALLIAVPVGSAAGYFGGLADALVTRFTETIMAFPLLLFLVFASARLAPELTAIAWGNVLPSGVAGEAVLIGTFTSFYPLRLCRAQLLTLRRAEFVEATRMVGAGNTRILARHLLPHLLPTLLAWAPIAVAANILVEVGLSFIGVGVQPSVPSWGSLLSTTWGTIYSPQQYDSHSYTPWQTILPTAAIVVTVVSLNQVADGIRRVLDPRGR